MFLDRGSNTDVLHPPSQLLGPHSCSAGPHRLPSLALFTPRVQSVRLSRALPSQHILHPSHSVAPCHTYCPEPSPQRLSPVCFQQAPPRTAFGLLQCVLHSQRIPSSAQEPPILSLSQGLRAKSSPCLQGQLTPLPARPQRQTSSPAAFSPDLLPVPSSSPQAIWSCLSQTFTAPSPPMPLLQHHVLSEASGDTGSPLPLCRLCLPCVCGLPVLNCHSTMRAAIFVCSPGTVSGTPEGDSLQLSSQMPPWLPLGMV